VRFKIGTMIKLSFSYRRNGDYAGKLGLIVDLDKHGNPIVKVGNEIRAFHYTQVAGVISESR
tara:strand:- start:1401 stop:1586 length:186 start_codon:yes stop_codon:yes gene_type:complete